MVQTCTLTTASEVKGERRNRCWPCRRRPHSTVHNITYLCGEFAAYPRVCRYAMQPLACSREDWGFPGDTIYMYGHVTVYSKGVSKTFNRNWPCFNMF
jgi:hypothetical protein